jgi:hypothetical protein
MNCEAEMKFFDPDVEEEWEGALRRHAVVGSWRRTGA